MLLTTTSLYEVGASQYNRIKVPATEFGHKIEYEKLGLTEGYGTFHLSQETLRLMDLLLGASEKRGKSVFGEGPSPLLRKIREAISVLGLPSHTVLNHKSRRIVYGISLAGNFREILTGRAHQPERHPDRLPPAECTKKITDYWKIRWLAKRLKNPCILGQVAKHTGAIHGARVQILSKRTSSQQTSEPQLNLQI